MSDYENTQLNILVGQAHNNACLFLNTKYNGDITGHDEELIELTKRLANDILTARKEFCGELPDMKIIEAIKGVNKANPKITFQIDDFEKASEPQKTLINEIKLMCNRLDTPEMRPISPKPEAHKKFEEEAHKHATKEERGCSYCGELLKDNEEELCKECMEQEEFGQKFG